MSNQGWFKATYTELIWDNLEGEWTDEFKLIKCFEDLKYFFNVLNILHNIHYLVENIFTQEKFCGFADSDCTESCTEVYSVGVSLQAVTAFCSTAIFSRPVKEECFCSSAWALKKVPSPHHQAWNTKSFSYENMPMRTATKPKKLVMLHSQVKGTQTYHTARCNYWTCLWH